MENKSHVTDIINKNILIPVDHYLPRRGGVFFAYNLCQMAVRNQLPEMVRFLIVHCGADLSAQCVQIDADGDQDARLESSETTFDMILTTLHEPVLFLRTLLDTGLRTDFEDGNQSRKTFTFGELGLIRW